MNLLLKQPNYRCKHETIYWTTVHSYAMHTVYILHIDETYYWIIPRTENTNLQIKSYIYIK